MSTDPQRREAVPVVGAPAARMRRRGRWVVAAVLVAALAGVGVAWWPGRDLGSGSALAARAADRLTSQPVALAGQLVDDLGVVSDVDALLAQDGKATLHLQRPGGAVVRLLSDRSRVLLQGNESFWLSERPSAATEYAGEWVELPSDHHLYKQLRPLLDAAALAELLNGAGVEWEEGEVTELGGVPALALVAGGMTVYVEADDPHRLLAFYGSHEAAVARRDAVLVASLAQPPPQEPPPGTPLWDLTAAEPSPVQVQVAQRDVEQVLAATPAPPSAAAAIAAPAAAIEVRGEPVCGPSPDGSCAVIVTVANVGSAPLQGTVHVTIDGNPTTLEVAGIPPAASQEFSFPSAGGQTTYGAYMFVPSLHGPDPARVQRLAERGIDPNLPGLEGTPMNAPQIVVADALGAALTTPEATDRYRVTVLPLLEDAYRRRYLATLHHLVASGRISNVEGLLPWLDQLQPDQRRSQVELAAALADEGHDLTLGATELIDQRTGTSYPGTRWSARPSDVPAVVVPPYLDLLPNEEESRKKRGKTSGTFVRPDGSEVPLVSGTQGPAGALPIDQEGRTRITFSHVEAQAAAIMREEGLLEGDLWINREPCDPSPYAVGCTQMLPQMFPVGTSIRIHVVPRGSEWPAANTHFINGIDSPRPERTALFAGRGGASVAGGAGAALYGAPGGIDFSSLELRYVADASSEGNPAMSYAFRALPSAEPGDPGVGWQVAGEASDALFVWLTLPPSSFTVNLNPADPFDIIDPELGRTDAGRVLLEADLQMKRTVAALIHPDTELGQQYWNTIAHDGGDTCLSMRQWIVPAEAVVHEGVGELYVLDAPLAVRMESEYLEVDGAPTCPQQSPEVTARNEEIFRTMILPRVEEAVNTAPEYAALRRVYLSRVVAEWYRERALDESTAFSDVIDDGDVTPWVSKEPWDPNAIFSEYVRSFEDGEFNVTRETVTTDAIEYATYVFGGVDFTDVPRRTVGAEEFAAAWPDLAERVSTSLSAPAGGADVGEIWLGAGPGPVAPMADGDAAIGPGSAPAGSAPPRYLIASVLAAMLVGLLLAPPAVRRVRAARLRAR